MLLPHLANTPISDDCPRSTGSYEAAGHSSSERRARMEEISCDLLPSDFALTPHCVHVWRISLNWSPARIQAFYQLLSEDEQQKADRFHFELDRLRHVIGRGVLRVILARCIGSDAAQLRFEYGAFGKPYLSPSSAEGPLKFNVSHSGNLIVIAITYGRAVGVDVEHVRNDIDVKRIAALVCSPPERAALLSLPPHLRLGAFFECWTQKEAFIKAVGDGFSLPVNRLHVWLLSRQDAAVTRPDLRDTRVWVIRPLDLGPDYRGAVAVEGGGWRLRLRDWSASSS